MPSNTVSVSMRYTNEKYRSIRVHPCQNHKEEERSDFNFKLSTVTDKLDIKYKTEKHPTALLDLKGYKQDKVKDLEFFVTVFCWNSCHKENKKKMEIVLALLE